MAPGAGRRSVAQRWPLCGSSVTDQGAPGIPCGRALPPTRTAPAGRPGRFSRGASRPPRDAAAAGGAADGIGGSVPPRPRGLVWVEDNARPHSATDRRAWANRGEAVGKVLPDLSLGSRRAGQPMADQVPQSRRLPRITRAQTDRSVVFSGAPPVARCWVRPARDGVPRPWAHGHVAAAFESPPDNRGGGPSTSSGRRTAPALAFRGGAGRDVDGRWSAAPAPSPLVAGPPRAQADPERRARVTPIRVKHRRSRDVGWAAMTPVKRRRRPRFIRGAWRERHLPPGVGVVAWRLTPTVDTPDPPERATR